MSLHRRPQPIRDMILAFLSEPRSARSIAAHIARPVPTATGHLAAMQRRGLVRRIGYAAYALAAYEGPPIAFKRPKKTAASPINGQTEAKAEHVVG